MRNRPWVIGLVGGIGSGKSTVAECFRSEGAEVLDADRIAHGLLDHPAVRRALVKEFGPGIVSGGRVDRGALAREGFRSRETVSRLNRIVHPFVGREIGKSIVKSRRRFVVVDAPLLLEAGAETMCDRIVFVDAPVPVRRRRIAGRGWGPGEMKRRERLQWSLSRKRSRSDYRIDNSGSRAATARQVRAVLRDLDLTPIHS